MAYLSLDVLATEGSPTQGIEANRLSTDFLVLNDEESVFDC